MSDSEERQMVKEAICLWKLVESLRHSADLTEGVLNGMVAALPNRAMAAYVRATVPPDGED